MVPRGVAVEVTLTQSREFARGRSAHLANHTVWVF